MQAPVLMGAFFISSEAAHPGIELLLTYFLEYAARKTKCHRRTGGTRSAHYGGAGPGARCAALCGFLRCRERPPRPASPRLALPRSSGFAAARSAAGVDRAGPGDRLQRAAARGQIQTSSHEAAGCHRVPQKVSGVADAAAGLDRGRRTRFSARPDRKRVVYGKREYVGER